MKTRNVDNRYTDSSSPRDDCSCVQASWFLTGDGRSYEIKKSRHGPFKPVRAFDAGGPGAFEIAARFSSLDLNDGLVQGDEENYFTLGLNWYPTAYTRFAANWVHFDIKKCVATNPFGATDHGGDAPGLTVQVDW